MNLRALLFDVNGTLIDIETDENMEEIYLAISRTLRYQGIIFHHNELKERYFQLIKIQQHNSKEAHAEFDAVKIWQTIIDESSTIYTRALSSSKMRQFPLFLAELHRAIARKRLKLYPEVEATLEKLHKRFPLAIVTDAQSAYANPELEELGIRKYFSQIIVSGDYGYRKPEARLFMKALDKLGVKPNEAFHVGNDMYHDVYGARKVGMKGVFYPTQYGNKNYQDTEPDYIIYHFGQLLEAVTFFMEQ